MRTNAERLLYDLSALRALLGSEARVHSYHAMSSIFSFGTENFEECPPTGVHDAFRQMMVFDHIGNLKVFYDNALVPFSIRLRGLEMVISPLTIDLEMGFCGVL